MQTTICSRLSSQLCDERWWTSVKALLTIDPVWWVLSRQTQFILLSTVHRHNRQPTRLAMSITERKTISWLRFPLPRRPEARRQRDNAESSRGWKLVDFEKRQRGDGQGSGGWLWGNGDELRNGFVPAHLTASVVEKGCWNWWPKAIREADPRHFTTACLCSLISLELSKAVISVTIYSVLLLLRLHYRSPSTAIWEFIRQSQSTCPGPSPNARRQTIYQIYSTSSSNRMTRKSNKGEHVSPR